MRKSILISTLSVALLSLVACGGKSGPAASGAFSDSEKSLYASLPADANVVFGAKYKDFMTYWENSPLKDMAMKGASAGGDMSAWMDCWGGVGDVEIAGTVVFGAPSKIRMVFRGMTSALIEKCAGTLPGVTVVKEDGGKHVVMKGIPDGMGGTSDLGYYFIDDKTAYFTMALPMGERHAAGSPLSGDLKALKADLASAAQSSVLDNAALQTLSKKTNRESAMWVCGSAAGTPGADQFKEGCFNMDASKDALTVHFVVELADAETAEMAVAQFKAAKSKVGSIPEQMAEMKKAAESLLEETSLDNDGAVLSGRIKLENSVIKPLVGMASMLGRF